MNNNLWHGEIIDVGPDGRRMTEAEYDALIKKDKDSCGIYYSVLNIDRKTKVITVEVKDSRIKRD